MKSFVIVTVLIVGLIGVGVYTAIKSVNKPEQQMTKDTSVMMDDSTSPTPAETMPDTTMMETSRYLEYSPAVLADSASTRRVLFFYANWCPTCRPANVDFETNSDKIPQDVTLIRVNYNDTDTDADEKSLAQKYGITYQHTFVQIDSSGAVVTKWNGGQTPELLSHLK